MIGIIIYVMNMKKKNIIKKKILKKKIIIYKVIIIIIMKHVKIEKKIIIN